MTRRLGVALVLGALMVSCGGSDGPSLSQGARAELDAKVASAEAAAAAHDTDGALRELTAITTRVDALERNDQISRSQAAAIHAAVIRVEGLLDLVTTTTTLPPDKPGKGHGKGKGKD